MPTTLRKTVKRLHDRGMLPPDVGLDVRDLVHRFEPMPRGSLGALLAQLNTLADQARPPGGGTAPYYRRPRPVAQDIATYRGGGSYIDLADVHLEPFGVENPVEEAASRFDGRAAAAVHADAWGFGSLLEPASDNQLLGFTEYDDAPTVAVPKARCLSLLALPDYFSGLRNPELLWNEVSTAISGSNPGWCGTFGPGVDAATDLVFGDPAEGNYDMSQMHLLHIAYRYYDRLPSQARERLIVDLLGNGRIHRPGSRDHFTSGRVPNDYARAGVVTPLGVKLRIGETENHVLMMHTVRYLTNQLLYQRGSDRQDPDPQYDNRRNGSEDAPACTELMLSLLRNILIDDFSEYNAKNYQTHTRYALLNLHSYAYDHEVRLAARMVLDYVSAMLAVSSNDLRRMVPFRRRNEGSKVDRDEHGFMKMSLIEMTGGADPMSQHFAILAGNTRIYETSTEARPRWQIKTDGFDGNDAVMYALSDYRLAPSIHDLFVNDLHRRLFQRLHRVRQEDVEMTGRTANNQEIYAGSPSYLITAGGAFATWAIDPGPVSLSAKLRRKNDQQLGVAMPTSFMPTYRVDCGDPTSACDLIQFGRFSDVEGVNNYGVAPDFACGHQRNLPAWLRAAIASDSDPSFGTFEFVNRGSAGDGPGFYLAFLRTGDLTVMEAFDTWLHPDLSFDEFRRSVFARNRDLMRRGIEANVVTGYSTVNGTNIGFKIWNDGAEAGAQVGVDSTYSRDAAVDSFGDAAHEYPVRLVNGSVLNSRGEGVVEITNLFLKTTLRLDLSDPQRPCRTDEKGALEEAGSHHEVWVHFGWTGPSEGDVFRPFNSLAAAAAAVADGGVIKILPGWTTERPLFRGNKRFRITAPLGDVKLGIR